eukprot:Platyproteum_vivax@DN6731_c0_g1_i2.p1
MKDEIKEEVLKKEEIKIENGKGEEDSEIKVEEDDDGAASDVSSPLDPDEVVGRHTSAQETFDAGAKAMKEHQYDLSSHLLAWAVSKKVEEIGGDDTDAVLAEYYLTYGDALLALEENSNDLLMSSNAYTTARETSGEPEENPASTEAANESSPNQDNESDLENLQISYENLEMGRTLFEKRKKDRPDDKWSDAEVLDLTYCHVRLGDLAVFQNQWDEGIAEYTKAIAIRREYKLPYIRLYNIYFALGVALSYGGHNLKAIEAMQEALKLLGQHLRGVDGFDIPGTYTFKEKCQYTSKLIKIGQRRLKT